MASDERYRDANGVFWLLHAPKPPETRWWSEQDAAQDRKYDPEPPGSIQGTMAALIADIQTYAKEHEGDLALKVTAKADSGAWFLLLLVVLAIADNK